MSSDSLAWLFGLEQFGIKLGLENISTLVDALGHPDRSFTSLHIAGTNGKGSVSAMLEAALRVGGHRTGLYTSPHLVNVEERFVINGSPVRPDDLLAVLELLRGLVDRLVDSGRLAAMPTFFEASTAAAFELFRRAGVETGVLEVGLGGRLDATTVVRPGVCAITSIGLDHERHLGTTIAAIAAEKAGILKPGIPIVIGRMPAAARAVIHERAITVGAPLIDVTMDVEVTQVGRCEGWDTGRVRITTPVRDYGEISLALRGTHQFDNAAVAVRVLETLSAGGVNLSGEAIAGGLASARWPGRLELRRLPGGREILFDAAHNPSGASTLARYLQDAATGRLPIVFAAARDKDIEGMLEALAPAASLIVATCSSNARSEEPATIAAIARRVALEVPIAVEVDALRALDVAWASSPSIVVAGSIFLLGDVMSSLGGS